MKKVKPAEPLKARKLIRINDYTWIEKRPNESDEATRERFLQKLARADSSRNYHSE
ncbi:MAG: hypothetical protein GX158_08810 [Bacteroidales bacterium]|jgi:hypothetical protein|nr:hypothetical protein [Bacteroidales bacterium]